MPRVPESKPNRLLIALTAMILLLAACSEPLDDADSTDSTSTSASSDSDDTATEHDADDADPTPAADSGSVSDAETDSGTDTTQGDEPGTAQDAEVETDTVPDDGSIVWQHRGEPWFLGTIPSSAVAADTSSEPIKIGMINQEDTPIGSFPEVRFAAEAAINWINAELGGVDGHPLEFHWCITRSAPNSPRSAPRKWCRRGWSLWSAEST